MKEEFEEYDEQEIHHGWLYPNHDTLVEKGFVEQGQQDRRTNVYASSRRGQRERRSYTPLGTIPHRLLRI